MPEAYIPLENAALLEAIDYEAMKKRLQRNPKQYKTQSEPRSDGGKDRVLVAVSSLSPRARRIYSRTNRTGEAIGDEIAMEKVNKEPLPWYAQVDCHWYIQNYPKQYEQGKQLAELMREFNDYCGEDRTGFSESFAAAHSMTQRTLYRNSQDYLTASSWALRYERTTGRSHDHFKVLSLCRKPKESLNSFPSLDPEVKALVENIWFNKAFRANNGTRQMLYTKLVDKCADSGVPLPSYQTIARYISYLMERQGGSSAEYLARRGLKDWKNQFMYAKLDEAIANGTTLREFRQETDGLLVDKGYEPTDPWDMENVFRTNLQTAYSVGAYQEMTAPAVLKNRPYWQYDAVDDDRTRPSHIALDGKVYPADDPIWDTIYPPNGFRCRCSVTTLSQRELEQQGLTVENQLPGVEPDPGFDTNPAKIQFQPNLDGFPPSLIKAYEGRVAK